MKKKARFNLRSFTSFCLVISTIIMSWSGFILYVAPPGRIANWGNWKLMLFTKAEWQALHTIFSYMFFILFVIHLFFVNWRTFLTYFKSKIKAGLNKKWELIAAVIVSIMFFIGTLQSWTPFGPVMNFGEQLKESWEKDNISPPVAHMEEYSLIKIAADFKGTSPEDLLRTLKDSSIQVLGTDVTLKTIAFENETTPSRIYEIISRKYSSSTVSNKSEAPSGVGKMTLNELALRLETELSKLISKVKKNGIDVTGETTIRIIADQMGITPHELYILLAGD
jgi:hypothetical protein